ncbi:putative reverse transcriptase domain-containing protein [Tanacetum coccineum]
MVIVRFHCPFVGLSGCHDGGGNGLTKTSLITHLRDRHCNGDAHVITKQSLTTNFAVFEATEVTFKRMGLWLCRVCFKTHTLRAKCRHGEGFDFVPPLDCGDGEVRFVLYDLTKPQAPSSSLQLDHVDELVLDEHVGFTLPLLNKLLSKGLRTVKSIPPKCLLGFSRILKGALDKVICTPDDIVNARKRVLLIPFDLGVFLVVENLDLVEQNVKQCKRKICAGHYTATIRFLSSSSVAPYNDVTLKDLKAKHPLKPTPSLPHIPIDHHQLIASSAIVLDMIKRFPCGMSSRQDGLAPLTSLVKPGSGIPPITVGSIWKLLVSNVSATMIGHSLDGYLNDLQFGVGVLGGAEAILHVVNWWILDLGDDVSLSMLLVDFRNAFNLMDHEVVLHEVRIRCPAISHWVKFCYSYPARLYYGEHALRSYQGVQQGDPLGPLLFALVLHPLVCKIRDSFNLSLQAWYLDDGTIIGDTLVMGEILKVIMEDGPRRDLHLNVDKTEIFWPKEEPRSRFAGVFPPNIARPLHGVCNIREFSNF